MTWSIIVRDARSGKFGALSLNLLGDGLRDALDPRRR